MIRLHGLVYSKGLVTRYAFQSPRTYMWLKMDVDWGDDRILLGKKLDEAIYEISMHIGLDELSEDGDFMKCSDYIIDGAYTNMDKILWDELRYG